PFFSATLGYNTWENIGSAVIEGVEGSFSFDIGAYFGWDFQLKPYASFVHLTRYEDLTNDRDLYYVEDSHVAYGITFSGKYGIIANLNLSYTGEQTIQDWSKGIFPAPVVKKGGFTVANFTVTKEVFSTKYGRFSLRGEIRNLFDKDYEYVKGYPMPERSFFVGLKFEL
ncbi:MAG: TonB-dependent receptor, partial [Deltaproteobacteria bacterium]